MGRLDMRSVPSPNLPHPDFLHTYILAAGGGAYYFAKRSINADKKARHEEDMRRQLAFQSRDFSKAPPPPPKRKGKALDNAASPASEASHDPAPTQHAPEHEGGRGEERSKYEASVPYRSKKGDRFS